MSGGRLLLLLELAALKGLGADVGVVLEVDAELLLLLDDLEVLGVDGVEVIEEEVVFAGELEGDLGEVFGGALGSRGRMRLRVS